MEHIRAVGEPDIEDWSWKLEK